MSFDFYMTRAPEGSTESSSVEAGIEPETPGLQRMGTISTKSRPLLYSNKRYLFICILDKNDI